MIVGKPMAAAAVVRNWRREVVVGCDIWKRNWKPEITGDLCRITTGKIGQENGTRGDDPTLSDPRTIRTHPRSRGRDGRGDPGQDHRGRGSSARLSSNQRQLGAHVRLPLARAGRPPESPTWKRSRVIGRRMNSRASHPHSPFSADSKRINFNTSDGSYTCHRMHFLFERLQAKNQPRCSVDRKLWRQAACGPLRHERCGAIASHSTPGRCRDSQYFCEGAAIVAKRPGTIAQRR